MYHRLRWPSSSASKSNSIHSQIPIIKGSYFTIYVDNLPNSVGLPWFRKVFGSFGSVVKSFLPNKKSRKTGNQFGFIRYASSRAVDVAISKANGLWVGKRYLIVERASFDKNVGPFNPRDNVEKYVGHSNPTDNVMKYPKPVLKPQFGKAP